MESISGSSAWLLLTAVLKKRFGASNVVMDMDLVESIPKLDDDELATNTDLTKILIRIMELYINPWSATIRTSQLTQRDNLIRNAVDFVLLEHMYQDMECRYGNIHISSAAIIHGRRAVKVASKSRKGGSSISSNVHMGYKLSEYLRAYVPKLTCKTLEGEPFIRLIRKLITNVYDSANSMAINYELPKSFLEPPNSQIKSNLRRGPVIKSRNGDRANLYIPYSWVKAAECAPMPEVIKREMTSLGAEVNTNLDKINNVVQVSKVNALVGNYKEYLKIVYELSDQCRSEWRRGAMIPLVGTLKSILVEDFPTNVEDWGIPGHPLSYLSKVRRLATNAKFVPCSDDASRLASIRGEISATLSSRKVSRNRRSG